MFVTVLSTCVPWWSAGPSDNSKWARIFWRPAKMRISHSLDKLRHLTAARISVSQNTSFGTRREKASCVLRVLVFLFGTRYLVLIFFFSLGTGTPFFLFFLGCISARTQAFGLQVMRDDVA